MKNHVFKIPTSALLLLLSAAAVRADYSNSVMALKPAAYWPLNESTSPNVYIATNSGTIGALGNAYYNNIYHRSGAVYTPQCYFTGPVAGVTSDGDKAGFFNGGTNNNDNGGYMIIPDINHALDQSVNFTAEAWVKPGGGDPNDVTGKSYSSTEWTSIMCKGGGSYAYNIQGDSAGHAYGWSVQLAGIYTIGYPVGWYTPGPVFLMTNAVWLVDFYNGSSGSNPSLEFMVPFQEPTPQWFHLALTYDGVNANFYTNGVLAATTLPGLPQSTNIVYGTNQSPITSLNGDYEFVGGFAPDTINPLGIGNVNYQGDLSNLGYPSSSSGTIGFNCQDYNGVIDEVAYYTNALSAATVLKHYQDATAANTSLYTNDVLSANPLVYLRFDEPASVFTQPPTNTLPVAHSYGSFAGAAGLYQPGIVAGTPGTNLPGFLSLTNAALFNGFDAAVDVGGGGHLAGTPLDPTGTKPFSVACWFKGDPSDTFGRFQTFLGRGDSGWRFDMDGSGDIHWNPGNGPELTTAASYNDGAWHQAIGTYDGNNVALYIDGQLSKSGTGAGTLSTVPLDLFIGGAPDYTTGSLSESRYFAGAVSHVAFFTNSLSAAQALALYDSAASLAPVITQDPQSTSVSFSGTASFNVVASSQPVQYQWYQGTTKLTDVPGNISGSLSSTLIISNVTVPNGGNYSVVVTNNYGSATSAVATLTVFSNVVITADINPTSALLYAGGHVPFSVQAGGAPPITYQWYSNNVAVSGATSSTFLLTGVQANTAVHCVASNANSSASSSTANVTVIFPTTSYASTILAANPVGFWRLNETNNPSLTLNDGATTYDYWGGNNGTYTNTALGLPSYDPNDTNDTAAQFGASTTIFTDNDSYNIPVDFSAPTNSNSAFSIEAWVKGTTGAQSTDAGLVSKGYGGGGEQFNLDCGAANHAFRFFVRDTGGATHGVNSSVNPSDAQWHHLVAVCDEPNGTVYLYIDGVLAGTNSIPPGSGILSSSRSMLIGARPSGASTANDDQFVGYMADVSVYNVALSQSQVLSHYYSAQVPAHIAVQPTNVTAGQFGTATFTALVSGTPFVGEQWFDAGTSLPIAGATNSTLVLNNVQSSQSGSSYYLMVTNAYGTNQSTTVALTVISGAPQIVTDVQSPFFALLGASGSDSVGAYGDEPLSFQWQFNGTNLSDNASISGSHSNVISVANAQPSQAGNYQVIVSNGSGSVTSSVALFIVGSSPVGFNINGGGWRPNGNAIIATNELKLTQSVNGQVSSFFYTAPQYIRGFRASYTYQDVTTNGADGSTFCIQNDTRGTAAIGGGGGQLGVLGITPSVELEFNIYGPNNVGYALLTDGATGQGGGVYQAPGSVNVASGDPINVVLNYANGSLAMTFTDPVAATTFSTVQAIDIPTTVSGDTAYVGFTGADGGVNSTQIITNFSFISIPPQTIRVSGANVVISWPSEVLGFSVQQNTNLLTSNWVTVTNPDVIANGLHNVTVPLTTKNAFYRLILP